jgi:hypothetical protein
MFTERKKQEMEETKEERSREWKKARIEETEDKRKEEICKKC